MLLRTPLAACLLALFPFHTSGNSLCGSTYQDALDSCSSDANVVVTVIPCPSGSDYDALLGDENECPQDKPYCFPNVPCEISVIANGTSSSGGNETQIPTPNVTTTLEPFTAQSPINLFFCGVSLEEANDSCSNSEVHRRLQPSNATSDDNVTSTNNNATWCPSGSSHDCPPGQDCFQTTACNATILGLVDFDLLSNLTTSFNATPSTSPTVDPNPNDFYCSQSWVGPDYDGDCGPPCPSGQNAECPDGTYCYGPQPNCIPVYKPGGGTRWCGATYADMADKCATECPNGRDDECPDGEICWGDSPCALIEEGLEDGANGTSSAGKLWCGSSYKDLVENCPAQCPSGTDEECPPDKFCYDMTDEPISCNTTGVGIQEATPPENLWCGSSWNNVLENCPMPCPQGSDEECVLAGIGMVCYDLTGNDLICETAGVGVKEKGDPNTRWCGSDFNDMLSTCPKRCPETTECDEGQTCFEGSPCVTEGVGIEAEEKDPEKMFCGSDYTAAMSCGTSCPNGDADCPAGESCYSDVECLWSATESEDDEEAATNPFLDETTAAATPAPEETTAAATVVATDATSTSMAQMFMDLEVEEVEAETAAVEDSEPVAEAEPAAESEPVAESEPAAESEPTAESEPATESEPAAESEPAIESEPAAESAPAESEPAVESAPAESEPVVESTALVNPFEEAPSSEVTSSGLVADNVRMALYGMPDMTSEHINAWESLTASYFEGFYNDYSGSVDSTRSAVNDVDTWFEFTGLDLASSRRGLRSRSLQNTAHLITYTQRIKYTSDGVTLGDVLIYPFNSPQKRADYIEYLKTQEPVLFASLEGVSTVFLPQGIDTTQTVVVVSAPESSETTQEAEPVSNSMVNPFEEEDADYTASSSGSDSEYTPECNYVNFECELTGNACPCGRCGDDEGACIYKGTADPAVIVGSYIQQEGSLYSNPEDASYMVSSVLDGEIPVSSTESIDSSTSDLQAFSEAAVDVDPLPYSEAQYGPKDVNGEMTLTGMNMIEVDNIFEWQYLTAVYEQNFYNNDGPTGDAVKDTVYNFATLLEVVDLSYGDDAGTPTTIIKFKQTFKYDTTDPSLSAATIATRPFLNQEDRDSYIAYLKEMIPETFGSLQASSSEEAAESTDSEGGDEAMDFLQKLTETFFCAESWPVDCATAVSCATGDSCPDGQQCFTAPMCVGTMQQNSAPVSSSTSEPDGASDHYLNHSADNGPSHVNGEMTLTGMNIIEVDNIFEWQDLTALFEEEFYNTDDTSSDYVKNSIHNFATALEVLEMSYGSDAGIPTTVIKFKQSIKYDTTDADIPVTAIVTQPFLTPEYRENYINYLKEMLPGSFSALTASSNVPDDEVGTADEEGGAQEAMDFLVKLRETFYCAASWPVDCATAERCETGEGCPDGQKCFTAPHCTREQNDSPATTSTPVSEEPQIEQLSSMLSQDELTTTTATEPTTTTETKATTTVHGATLPAYESEFYCGTSWLDASDRCYKPCPSGDASDCDDGEGCFAFTSCQQKESFFCGESFEHATSTCGTSCSGMSVFDCPQGQGCFQYTTCLAEGEPSGESAEETEEPLISYCGTSQEDAELTCATGHAIACKGDSDKCPGSMECYETTSCNTRDGFYCGSSWRDAAETCGKPCSSGSSDECADGQFCFAYTGCDSHLFFCGETFEDASASCTSIEGPTSCSNRDSDSCPDGQYCFAFVSECQAHVDNFSHGAFGDFGSLTGSESDAPKGNEPGWLAGYWETKEISSSSTRAMSLLASSLLMLLCASL